MTQASLDNQVRTRDGIGDVESIAGVMKQNGRKAMVQALDHLGDDRGAVQWLSQKNCDPKRMLNG